MTIGGLLVVSKDKRHLYVFASVGKSKLFFGVVRLLSIIFIFPHCLIWPDQAFGGNWKLVFLFFYFYFLCFLCHFLPLKSGTYIFKRNLGYPSSWPSSGYSSLFFIFQTLILHYIMARVYHCTYKKNEEKMSTQFL